MAAECGYNGEQIDLYYSAPEFTRALEVCEIIVSQLQEAGFNVVFNQMDSAAWDQAKNSGSWDLSLTNWAVPIQATASCTIPKSLKKQYWNLETADEMIASLYQPGITLEQREETLQEVMQYCWDQVPWLWATDQVQLCARDKNLTGVEVVPLGLYRFTYASYQ